MSSNLAPLDGVALERMFADDGAPCPHVYVSCWMEASPQTKTVALWKGGPRGEVYNAVEERDAKERPAPHLAWRLLVFITRATWERWKGRQR